jgi:hypothetical protein
MSDIFVKFSYGCKNIIFELNTANKPFLILNIDFGRFVALAYYTSSYSNSWKRFQQGVVKAQRILSGVDEWWFIF